MFTDVTRGESPLVALRVVTPTPNAVVLHGLDETALWDHAADLARIDGFSLAVAGSAATMISAFLLDFDGSYLESLLLVNSGFTTFGFLFVMYSLVIYE